MVSALRKAASNQYNLRPQRLHNKRPCSRRLMCHHRHSLRHQADGEHLQHRQHQLQEDGERLRHQQEFRTQCHLHRKFKLKLKPPDSQLFLRRLQQPKRKHHFQLRHHRRCQECRHLRPLHRSPPSNLRKRAAGCSRWTTMPSIKSSRKSASKSLRFRSTREQQLRQCQPQQRKCRQRRPRRRRHQQCHQCPHLQP